MKRFYSFFPWHMLWVWSLALDPRNNHSEGRITEDTSSTTWTIQECNTSATGEKTCRTKSPNDPPRRNHNSVMDYEPTCVYYMAPSSIPHSGFGTYTVRDIPAHTCLMKQADAPTIVITDPYDFERNGGKRPLWIYDNYVWGGEGYADFEADNICESVTTFGAIANFHPYLFNLHPTVEEFDDTITPRGSGSPGIGAYSYHMGYNYQTDRAIQAGEELFTDYGQAWFDSKGFGDSVPRKDDYIKGGKIVLRMLQEGLNMDTANENMLKVMQGVVSMYDARAAHTLPKSMDAVAEIISMHKAFPQDMSTSKIIPRKISDILAKNSLLPRTMDWILSEGKCLDNLVPQVSTLKDAGRGAFAQRFIPKDSMVVPAPILQIPNYSDLFMHDPTSGEIIGAQMLLNYCFSHKNTPMLLCPQSNAILMNHCSIQSGHKYGGLCAKYNSNSNETLRGPNAFIRWGTSWDPDTEKWLDASLQTIREWTRQGKRGLSMEVIASRDIHPGEEVFIDYGNDWEAQWDIHVKDWKPPSAKNYKPVKQMNEEVMILRTPDELKKDPYPENVVLGCLYSPADGEEESQGNHGSPSSRNHWITEDDAFMSTDGSLYWPCRVLDRIVSGGFNEGVYSVQIFQSPSNGLTKWHLEGFPRIINRFPRRSIKFYTAKYASDQHLRGVFREPIGLPDDMLPSGWNFDESRSEVQTPSYYEDDVEYDMEEEEEYDDLEYDDDY